ncbi:MAG: adenine nucleotide alpha hydrolase [Crocinitomicaceae bacterium]|nr:adenine nucleotide alpha hydrolase [Crocinitomicaceae bacterium]NGF76362.1 adenine nucleotide alpha hydrolase [Fluviicola sp. SGL-29]
MVKKKAVFNWSGGKDSALALSMVLNDDAFEVVALLTTVYAATSKSLMHGIPLELLTRQAESIGIPLQPVYLDADGRSDRMEAIVMKYKEQGVTHFVFGDIFLEDIKAYRESKLHPYGIEVVEPLWGKTSEEVMNAFFATGIRSTIVVTQADKLDETYIGKDLSPALIESFPEDVDLCGENGEYHTFSYAGALFKTPVAHTIRDVVKLSYDLQLDTGEKRTIDYWQAVMVL